MAKENLMNAEVGTIIRVKGELGNFSKHLLIPRTDEEVAEEESRQRQMGWKYPRGFRIEANIDNPVIICKIPKTPDEAEKYLAGKIFQRKEYDGNGNETGEKIKTFTIQSQGKYAPKLGVKGDDGKIHQVDLETGEIVGTGRSVEMPSKILVAGQVVTATYEIRNTKNGKTAALVNLVLEKDPVFFKPERRDNAGEDWDNIPTQSSAPAEKTSTSTDSPVEEEDDSDKWA